MTIKLGIVSDPEHSVIVHLSSSKPSCFPHFRPQLNDDALYEMSSDAQDITPSKIAIFQYCKKRWNVPSAQWTDPKQISLVA